MVSKEQNTGSGPEQTQVNDVFSVFRAGFPALKEQTYLSVCDKMILHDAVRASVEEYLDHLALASSNRVEHEVKVTGSKEKFAELVNVPSSTVAAIRNVSDGVNTIAWALPFSEGDNIVLTTDAEHPNNIYPWLRLQRRGLELRIIPQNPDGSINTDAMVDAIDSRTKAMTCASVSFAPGFKTDIAPLAEACKKNDVFLLIDGVQSAGILRHDFVSEGIDGFATSTSKGILGLYGYGFLYVSEKWIDRMEPAYLSRPAVDMTADDYSAMGNLDYQMQPDSRRFEVGSFNLAGAYAANRSLEILLELGSEEIEARVLSLASRLGEGCAEFGFAPAVPLDGPQQSHIVTFGALDAGGHGFSDDPRIEGLSERLKESRVAHTIRRGQLRFAIHAYNDDDDIDRTVEHVRAGYA